MRVFPPSWSLRTLLCATIIWCSCENLEPLNPNGPGDGSAGQLVLSPSNVTLNAIGDTLSFDVHLGGSSTALQASTLHWATGNANVVALTDLGHFISTGVGVAVVTVSCAQCGANGDTATVRVQQVVANVYIEPGGNTLVVGDEAWVTAVAADSNAVPIGGASFEWTSSDPDVVTIGSDGRIEARSVGTAWVTAAVGEMTGRARIEVTDRAVHSIEVSPADAALMVGDTVEFTAVAFDSEGAEIEGASFGWSSSDSSVARVIDGRVAGLSPGGAEIIASARGNSGTATVTVSRSAAHSIEVSPADTVLEPGNAVQLQAVAYDEEGRPIEGLAFEWSSSEPDVASVSDGMVEARSEGSATMTARADEAVGQATIRVESAGGGTGSADAFMAFPGAEGHGALALTGCDRSPPEVRFVTNRNDSGSGSLREAVNSSDPDRLTVVIFRTGGSITVSSEIFVNRGCLYIAGQTAPGDGVQLRRPDEHGHLIFSFPRSGAGRDVVMRYLRVRSGRGEPGKGDNISITGGRNIMLDHLSLQWSNDENIGFNTIAGHASINRVSIQRSIIAEALRSHSTGLLIGGTPDGTYPPITEITIAHNLFAHNAHRNPRIAQAGAVSVVSNVMYNWHSRAARTVYAAEVDYIGNYFKVGPWSDGRRIIEHEWKEPFIDPSVYLAQNVVDPTQMDPDDDNRKLITYHHEKNYEPLPSSAFRSGPNSSPPVPITVRSAPDALGSVLADVGANRRLACDGSWVNARDRIDADIVRHVQDGTGPAVEAEIDHQDDFGGYPNLSAGTPCPDEDGDGMPDAFEERFGLDPRDAGDARLDSDGDGYTNIEEYVNGTRPR